MFLMHRLIHPQTKSFSHKTTDGFTLVELLLALTLVFGLSFWIFKASYPTFQLYNDSIIHQEAKRLANLLEIDFRLSDQSNLNSVDDFFGFYSTQLWPINHSTVFTQSQWQPVNEINEPFFTPNWSQALGLYVEYTNRLGEEVRVYPGHIRDAALQMIDPSLDNFMLVRFQLGQVGSGLTNDPLLRDIAEGFEALENQQE